MKKHVIILLLVLLIPALALAQVVPYTQDFEGLTSAPEDPTSVLASDGWKYFVNVFFSPGDLFFSYGGSAPNVGTHMSAVVEGEGGPAQEMKQLSIFSDYLNAFADHGSGYLVETNIFQEQFLNVPDLGQIWTMTFDAKLGNLEGATTAAAYIKTFAFGHEDNPSYFVIADMTSIPASWNSYSVSLTMDPSLLGHVFQFGFTNTASNYEGSGVFYDNINLSVDGAVATEEASFGSVKALFR